MVRFVLFEPHVSFYFWHVSFWRRCTLRFADYKESLTSEYYNFDRTTFGTQHHARYTISVTYTVGYGKKVQRKNEMSGSGTAGSAILK